jgi:hypothetical protein
VSPLYHRPAIANERLKRNRAGQVVLQLMSPYKDGTTHKARTLTRREIPAAEPARLGLPARRIGAKAALRRRHHEKSIRGNLNPHPQAIVSLIKHRTLRCCGAV